MARRPKIPPQPVTREEKMAAALEKAHDRNWLGSNNLISEPMRTFAIGEEVLVGCLDKAIIVQSLFDGKAYLLEVWHKGVVDFNTWWWFEIDKKRHNDGPSLFEPYRVGQLLHSGFDSLIHLYLSDGLVCDPTFQRGYVWTDVDREALLTSVFERLDIGSFALIRHHGYLHPNDKTPVRYMNLHGEEVFVRRDEDFTVSIIDGQQRLTTLINFYLDRLTYKGIYFSQMKQQDKSQFENTTVGYRIIEEENISKVEILKMFLQANRGVPQTSDHLAKVQALYQQELAKVKG